MNKAEFTTAVMAKVKEDDIKCAAAANRVIDAVFDVIKEEVANGGKVSIANFGTFESVQRAEKTCINPATGETMTVESKVVPKFHAGKGFKDAVKK